MYLNMLRRSKDVQHRVCHVLRLQAVERGTDGRRPRRVVRVHGGLELGLDEARRDGGHPDVGASVPHLLPPALKQAGHRKLGRCVKP